MRFYKIIDSTGRLIAIGVGDDGTEITAEEYNSLLGEINAKWDYIGKLADGKITAADVPVEWRTEVQAEADAIIKAREEAANQPVEISAEEALGILLGGETA